MATPATLFSLEHHLLDRLKFSGVEKENLADLVSIVVSLRNKYGITPGLFLRAACLCQTAWWRAI